MIGIFKKSINFLMKVLSILRELYTALNKNRLFFFFKLWFKIWNSSCISWDRTKVSVRSLNISSISKHMKVIKIVSSKLWLTPSPLKTFSWNIPDHRISVFLKWTYQPYLIYLLYFICVRCLSFAPVQIAIGNDSSEIEINMATEELKNTYLVFCIMMSLTCCDNLDWSHGSTYPLQSLKVSIVLLGVDVFKQTLCIIVEETYVKGIIFFFLPKHDFRTLLTFYTVLI